MSVSSEWVTVGFVTALCFDSANIARMRFRTAIALCLSLLGACDRNTSDHMPGEGNSTSPTVRKLVPDCENSVSNTCLRPL